MHLNHLSPDHSVSRCTARAPSQGYIDELYKKDLHDPDNHDGVITYLEPDILECEVKWALGSITMNKASGGDGTVELFQILKDDAVKMLHSIYQLIWKTQQWSQDWKRSVFIPVPQKGNGKDCSIHLCLFCCLVYGVIVTIFLNSIYMY